jgi:CheY-like chemotaxis protein
MTLPLNEKEIDGTDQFNRVQLQIAAGMMGGADQRVPDSDIGLLRVLIVDDDRDTVEVMARLVRHWGHDVQKAHDGITALRAAECQAPDVVLLDIAMPHMDGCQLAERLRGDARLGDCFLIAISGCFESASRARCRASGIDLFLLKPVQASVLETILLLESLRLGRRQSIRGQAAVSPTVSAVAQFVEAWEVVPRFAVAAVGI